MRLAKQELVDLELIAEKGSGQYEPNLENGAM